MEKEKKEKGRMITNKYIHIHIFLKKKLYRRKKVHNSNNKYIRNNVIIKKQNKQNKKNFNFIFNFYFL